MEATAVCPHEYGVARGWGRIINIAWVGLLSGMAEQAANAASKAVLLRLTRSARLAGIRATPAQRTGEPAEVAAAVAFLCSDGAAYINGVALPVDGGMSL